MNDPEYYEINFILYVLIIFILLALAPIMFSLYGKWWGVVLKFFDM
jgi:hypothetical protein